jgi:hypothetical protein
MAAAISFACGGPFITSASAQTTEPTPLPIRVAFTTPANEQRLASLTLASGTAQPNTGGTLSRVLFYMKRRKDNYWWTGAEWRSAVAALPTTLSEGNWSKNSGFPSGTGVSEGYYDLYAQAFNTAGQRETTRVAVGLKMGAPVVTIASPASASSIRSIAAIKGTARDNEGGSGVDHVDAYLQRRSDERWWTGVEWSLTRTRLATSLSEGLWSCTAALPTGDLLPQGAYRLQVSAFDRVGLSTTAVSEFKIDRTAPAVSFSSPLNSAQVASFSAISGKALDSDGGSGISRVYLYIQRASDSLYWNGSAWVTEGRMETTFSEGTWSRSLNLPSGTNLPNGEYRLSALAYDRASNYSWARIVVNKVSETTPPPTTSSVRLSGGEASSVSRIIWLAFSGPLNAERAANVLHYKVLLGGLGGTVATIDNVTYEASTNRVRILMPSGTLVAGARVRAEWRELTDASGLPLANGGETFTIR